MNWEALGALAELVGAAAVVLSLLYLAAQIRSQTKQDRLAAMHDIAAGFREATANMAEPGTAQILVKTLHDGVDSLRDDELFCLVSRTQGLLRLWEEAFYLHRDGKLDDRYWDGMNRQLASFMATQVFAHTWKIRQEYYGSEFRDMVNNLGNHHYSLR